MNAGANTGTLTANKSRLELVCAMGFTSAQFEEAVQRLGWSASTEQVVALCLELQLRSTSTDSNAEIAHSAHGGDSNRFHSFPVSLSASALAGRTVTPIDG